MEAHELSQARRDPYDHVRACDLWWCGGGVSGMCVCVCVCVVVIMVMCVCGGMRDGVGECCVCVCVLVVVRVSVVVVLGDGWG